ncbi:glutamine amidotransferase [Marinobacter bryozoorum]|uniref:glutamine amidotransferase n=1 Tax=Marinobacter bryozoorum TaxID=256324 RepID=UPI0020035DBE|nr:glutamine amidotransferase [Marinobacter bryozoorum]MCK7545577.1 glutamine amidotransferase [Marinobacter bryozoorum]
MAGILILKTGSTYADIQQGFGDFDRWFRARLERSDPPVVVDVTCEPRPGEPSDWLGIIVTGSPAMVTDQEPWSENAAAWLREAARQQVPVLGVCYGHQLLAHALGGRVGFRPQGRESGTFDVSRTPEGGQDPLLGSLPPSFPAHLTHAQSVLALPPGAVLLAKSDGEPHQAFRVGSHAWGVQFHPEFTEAVMTAYLNTQADSLAKDGQDPQRLLETVRPTPEATSLIARFEAFACARGRAPGTGENESGIAQGTY